MLESRQNPSRLHAAAMVTNEIGSELELDRPIDLLLAKGSSHLLTAEQEKILISTSQDESLSLARRNAARDQIVVSNYRLVLKIAKYMVKVEGTSLEDRLTMGVLGLIKAISKFDIKKNLRLSTYATAWIRQSIQRNSLQERDGITVPNWIVPQINKLLRAELKIENRISGPVTSGTLEAELGWDSLAVEKVRQAYIISKPFSLDAPVAGSDNNKQLDSITPNPTTPNADQIINRTIIAQIMSDIAIELQELSPIEQVMIIEFYDLPFEKPEIEERVNNVKEAAKHRSYALKKLKRRLYDKYGDIVKSILS